MSTTAGTVRHRPIRQVAVAYGALVLLLGAAACGNGNGNATATGSTPENAGPQNQQGGPVGQFPGANGKVAAVAGSTAQVQSVQNGQVAVTWTGSTSFSKQVTAALSEVKVGSCVAVSSVQTTSSSGSSTPATAVTAASVRIVDKVNGTCGFGDRAGGPGLTGGPQGNGQPPSGAPSGGSRPQIRGFGGAIGEVTAVAAGSFVVASQVPGSDTRTNVTVTVDRSTTYTATAKGAASDVKVGVCVQANGSTDSTGAVTARTIAVSQPENGQCGGFARFRAGDGGTGQQGS